MGLIKSNNTPPSLSPFSMRDIEAQARAILLRTQQQADQMLAEAHVECERIRQRGYDAGFAAGREDGVRKGGEDGRAAGQQAALKEHRAKLEELGKTLAAAILDLDESRARLESTAGSEVVKLAVAIGRRATKLQGQADPQVLMENVHAAMRLVVHNSDVRIAVHPSQKQALADVLPKLRVNWPMVTHVDVVEDAALSPGGCQVFTARGEIDADLDRQIDRIAADLLPAQPEAAT